MAYHTVLWVFLFVEAEVRTLKIYKLITLWQVQLPAFTIEKFLKMKNIIPVFLPVIILLSNLKANPLSDSGNSNITRYAADTTEKKIRSKDYEATTAGISFSRIETYFDSGYYPRSLYYNIRFAEVTGISMQEATSAKLMASLFDEKNKNVPLPKEARFYVAHTFKEGAQLNILISIPLNPADANNKNYRFTLSLEKSTGKEFINMKGKVKTQ